jgi:hypothetical protein
MEKAWSCPDCKTTDENLRYPSGKVTRCLDCQKFYNLSVNSKSKRARSKTPKLKLTREKFVAWVRASSRTCRYCGVGEATIPKLHLTTQIGRSLHALGVDRLDSTGDYTASNIALCCFACNKAKGNVFADEEMIVLGRAIAEVWKVRLAASQGSAE